MCTWPGPTWTLVADEAKTFSCETCGKVHKSKSGLTRHKCKGRGGSPPATKRRLPGEEFDAALVDSSQTFLCDLGTCTKGHVHGADNAKQDDDVDKPYDVLVRQDAEVGKQDAEVEQQDADASA